MMNARPARPRTAASAILVSAILLLVALLPVQQVAAVTLNSPNARQVQQMYVAYYGRPGDPAGVEYWANRLAKVGG